MKRRSILNIVAALLCLSTGSTALAQTADGSMLFNPTVNLSSGAQNSHVGSVGGVFLTTYNHWPFVNWLGYYDKDGDGLANSHQVSLWYTGGQGGNTPVELARVTVPAGTEAPLYSGYRWVHLASDAGLWYGSWYTIAAQTDAVDTWGDLVSGSTAGWNTQYVDLGDGWGRAGRYDSAASWPGSPANQVGTSDSIFPAANMGFNLPIIPEPGSLTLLGLGALVWCARRARHPR